MKKNFHLDTLNLVGLVLEESVADQTHVLSCGVVVTGKLSKETAELIGANITAKNTNLTFYPDWDKNEGNSVIRYMDQFVHYLLSNSARGVTIVPNVEFGDPRETGVTAVNVVQAVPKEVLVSEVVQLLDSGIAMDEEQLKASIRILSSLGYDLEKAKFRNKEANAMLDSMFDRMPSTVEGLLKLLVTEATGKSTVIKNQATIDALKAFKGASDCLEKFVKQVGIKPLAENFNRYKPLLLALKRGDSGIVNQASRMSKKAHKPMKQAAVNEVTARRLKDTKELEGATVFALLRAMNAVHLRMFRDPTTPVLYKVRNGKVFVTEEEQKVDFMVLIHNYKVLKAALSERVDGEGTKLYIPSNVDYALPTSAKSFVGGVPENTIIEADGDLCVGMYWEDAGGARDLDLSSCDISGVRVGWNTSWHGRGLAYSGDITSAPNGAEEYFRVTPEASASVIYLNVYSGNPESAYEVRVGQTRSGNTIEDVVLSAPKITKGSESILGFVLPSDGGVKFVLSDMQGMNKRAVSRSDERSKLTISAVVENATSRVSLKDVLGDLNYVMVDSVAEADVDLSPNALATDTLVKLFT